MRKDLYWMGEGKEKVICGAEAASSDDNNKVDVVNNRIYFYSEVTRPKNLELIKAIANLDISMQNRSTSLNTEPGKIYVHINSYGGSVFAGLSSVDYILSSKTPVV